MIRNFEACIQACADCSLACRRCSAACLSEPNVEMMSRCIQLDLACAAICDAAVEGMLQLTNQASHICQACADACNACAEECEKHERDHCRQCAEACRNCASICLEMGAA